MLNIGGKNLKPLFKPQPNGAKEPSSHYCGPYQAFLWHHSNVAKYSVHRKFGLFVRIEEDYS
jgi:hypothetical protein